MDSSKINANATWNSKSEFKRSMRFNKESNENEGHSPRRGFATKSQVPKKKILAERNSDEAPLADSCNTHLELETIPNVKPIICCSSEYIPLPLRVPSSPYDPVNNFTSPRPKFLRYNPNRLREILHRMEDEITDGEESSSSSDQRKEVEEEASPESFPSPKQENFQQVEEEGSDAEVDDDDAREEEVEERPWCSRMVWKLLIFLFGVFLFSCHDLFPMSSSTPPLQENGGSREITKPQGPRNLSNVDLLIAHMGLSDMCFNAEGLMCAIDEDRSSFIVLDEFSEEAHDGDLAIGEQGVNNDLVTSDEVTGMLNSEEEDLHYGIEDTEERDEEKLAEDSSTRGYKSEEVELYILNNLFFEEEHDVRREESGAEAMDTDNDIHLKDTHILQPSDAPPSPIRGYSEAEIYSEDETEAGSLPVPRSALALLPQVDQGGDQIVWAHHFAILVARARLLFVPMNLLAAALLGLSVCIFRHMLNLKASSSPKLLPRSKSLGKKRLNASVKVVEELRDRVADEKRINPAAIEEFRDDGKEDSRLRPLPSNHLTYESDASYATRPPTVQLLGEFSFAEPTVSKIGTGQNSKRTEPEESQLSRYQSKKRTEDSEISQYHVRSARKNISSSASKVHPSTASTVDGSHTTQEKLPRTEDTGTRREVKILATPLRRSDRIRNRVTSP